MILHHVLGIIIFKIIITSEMESLGFAKANFFHKQAVTDICSDAVIVVSHKCDSDKCFFFTFLRITINIFTPT